MQTRRLETIAVTEKDKKNQHRARVLGQVTHKDDGNDGEDQIGPALLCRFRRLLRLFPSFNSLENVCILLLQVQQMIELGKLAKANSIFTLGDAQHHT